LPRAQNSLDIMQLAEFEIQLIRSRRKSLSLQIKPEGVILRAPQYAPKIALKAFALSKLNWLRKHQQKFAKKPKAKQKQFIDGEKFLFKGNEITLQIIHGNQSDYFFNSHDKTITISLSQRIKKREVFIKKQIISWYKSELLNYLENTVPSFAKQMVLQYTSISVKQFSARWGSCSHTGDLTFNWHLMMAPEQMINSVIIHELAHIKHFNHSKDFWNLVFQHCHDYKNKHKWLSENQYLMKL
jgi:predicted metal-dependent hydrolase